MKYEELPPEIQQELVNRHTHAEIAYDYHPDQIVYKEQDVIDLMEIFADHMRGEEVKSTASLQGVVRELITQKKHLDEQIAAMKARQSDLDLKIENIQSVINRFKPKG